MIALFPSRAVALELFGFSLHWYGLLYFTGFVLGYLLLPKLQRYRGLHYTKDEWSRLISWAVVGVIVGGRLGFVLFYEPSRYLADPLEAFAVWHGGMSSHGGFIGVVLCLWWALKHKKSDMARVADTVVIPVAIGLALGRFGNFLNQELYGLPTTLPWGIRVPTEPGPVHPTQLYAIAKDLFIALVCSLHLRRPGSLTGRTCALFLMLYGVLRFLVEFLRVQEYAMVDLGFVALSRGQVMTVGIFIAGVVAWWWAGRAGKSRHY